MFSNQFGLGISTPSCVFLLVSISSIFFFHPCVTQGKELCFRKYDTKRLACKYLVADRDSSENRTLDIEICCSTYGQGHAAELKRMTQLRRKWYACIPCHREGDAMIDPSSMEEKFVDLHPRIKYSSEDTPSQSDKNHNAQESTGDEAEVRRSDTKQDSSFDSLMKEFSAKEEPKKDSYKTSISQSTQTQIDWGRWSEWSACSRTCGPPEGTQRRTRRKCSGDVADVEGCAEEYEERTCQPSLHCRVDGGWSNWTISQCSVTCGEGHQMLTRLCNNPVPAGGGKDCQGDMEEVRPCTHPTCPVDGGWADWSDWTPCPAVCSVGVQTRIRTCTNPPPKDGGRPCRGLQEESAPCSSRSNCPVNGNWSEWSKWDICSARPCSGQAGHRIRFRTCTNPRPMFGGRPCRGRTWERETCYNNDYCTETVNGGWCGWSNWTECSAEVQIRTRVCQCPPSANGGTECEGVNMEERICETTIKSDVLQGKARTERSGAKSGCPNEFGSGEYSDDSSPDCDREERGDEEDEEGSAKNESG